MGSIIFNGKTIYKGPLASWTLNTNWCDSMAEYYPYLWVSWLDTDGKEVTHKIWPGYRLSEHLSDYTIELDKWQTDELAAKHRRELLEKAARKINYHKVVKVIRGRKVPIGTTGEVMWMGDNGYGPQVGIRLLDGKVVFTAQRNVEVVLLDKEFEEIVLKEKE